MLPRELSFRPVSAPANPLESMGKLPIATHPGVRRQASLVVIMHVISGADFARFPAYSGT